MKKLLAVLLALSMLLCMAACAKTETAEESTQEAASSAEETAGQTAEAPAEESVEESAEAPAVMSHDEYIAAATDTQVTVETYIQAKQGWWEKDGVGVSTFYTQAEDGAYFLYNMPCTQDEYDKLTEGTKILVTGYKSEWSGEVEIIDAAFTIQEGTFIAEPEDVTALLASDDLINHQNEKVCFKGMTVEAANDSGDAFLYNWDGSGTDGDDLYFNVSIDGNTYSFTVESYLCGAGTEVYEAVKALQVGDVIDLEGYLYWYEGVNPHITAVSPAA